MSFIPRSPLNRHDASKILQSMEPSLTRKHRARKKPVVKKHPARLQVSARRERPNRVQRRTVRHWVGSLPPRPRFRPRHFRLPSRSSSLPFSSSSLHRGVKRTVKLSTVKFSGEVHFTPSFLLF